MKKCPVCGVEHSDIVHVCSICGSSLDDAPVVESSAADRPVEPEAVQPASKDAFATDDIQETISSIVKATVAGEEPEVKDDAPFEEDSPFVIDATNEPTTVIPPQNSRKGKHNRHKKHQGAQNQERTMDTTAVAAVSAQKVYEAAQNAIRARNAQNAAAAAAAAKEQEQPVQEPKEAKKTEQQDPQWSERKHTREKSNSSRKIVMAACALLVLLILALLIVFGKMLSGEGSGTPVDNKDAVTEDQNTAEETQTPDEQSTDILPAADAEQQAQEAAEQAEQDAQQEDEQDAVDPDLAAAENNAQQGDQAGEEQAAETAETAEEKPEETKPAELPAITDANDTVYAVADVNVRDYPGTQGSSVINVLSAGQSAKRTGTTANGWSRVEIAGKVGYVSNKYLSTSKQEAQAGQNADTDSAVAVSGVNIRKAPNGEVIGTLGQGQKVKLTGKKEGNWVEITVDGVTGYVYSTYLSGSGSNQASTHDVKVKETNDTVYAVSGVNVRNAPTASGSTVLTTLTQGQKVTRIGTTSNGWSKVKVGDVTGYVSSGYLSTSKDGEKDDSGSSKSRSGYILPDASSRVYSTKELKNLSASQLRLARNEIYARHGRKFNDASLQEYFNSCSWYKGTVDPATFDANVSDYLNSNELANLNAIAAAEN